MATFTIVINEASYSGERAWNGLRFAKKALESGLAVNLFLMADAVYVSPRNHKLSLQAPNLEPLLEDVLEKGARVKGWVEMGMMQDLVNGSKEADQAISF